MMCTLPNFRLQTGRLSQQMLKRGISDFHAAIRYVRQLPYGRTSNCRHPELLMVEKCGTRSVKHAFLVQLAYENQVDDLRLAMCTFNIDAQNTEAAAPVLSTYQIDAIPEVTCLLKYKDEIFDLTSFTDYPAFEVMSEIEIAPLQIGNFKRRYHLNYIESWLELEKIRHYSVEKIWQIREACIQAIAASRIRRTQPLCCVWPLPQPPVSYTTSETLSKIEKTFSRRPLKRQITLTF